MAELYLPTLNTGGGIVVVESTAINAGLVALGRAPAGGSISYYYPESTGCDAWYGRDPSPPNDLATWKDNNYTPEEEATVSVDDSNSVDYECLFDSGWQYAGHLFMFHIDEASPSQLDILLKMYNSGGEYGDLEIWNADSTAWELQDSYSDGAPEVFSLTGQITSSVTDYIDGSGNVHVVVYDDGAGVDAGCEVRFARLKVTP